MNSNFAKILLQNYSGQQNEAGYLWEWVRGGMKICYFVRLKASCYLKCIGNVM